MQGPSRARRRRAPLLALLLVAAGLATGACTEPGATPGPAETPAPSIPAASGIDGGLPSGEACSIATACPSPTQ